MKRAALLLMLAGCGLPSGDLLTSPPAWKDCDAALKSAKNGDTCVGFDACKSNPSACCIDMLSCTNGLITGRTQDCSFCNMCGSDAECPSGTWCISGACSVCPVATGCPMCPAPFVPLSRNGCATCDCGPPSACTPDCTMQGLCQPSLYCQSGCSGPDCCVDQCVVKPCGLSAVGCQTDCAGDPACGFCVTANCTCGPDGLLSCDHVCAPELKAYAGRCFVPVMP